MHRVLADQRINAYETRLGKVTIKRAAEEVFDRARASRDGSYDAIVGEVSKRLDELCRQRLVRVINATGILIHTNLGRVPLSESALEAVVELCSGYSNLEYDLGRGERGSRYDRLSSLLDDVTGAESSLAVNNCAAAVLLVLDTFAKGREVIVARSELVEIGGGFRVPEVLERSGAALVEVGTTNRVYVEDFERALSPRTALILRTHRSNYRIEGFTHDAKPRELVEVGRRAGVPVVEDLGSGALADLVSYGAHRERTVQDALADGTSLVTFSGDKLLGGPQAGIIVGNASLVARLRSNPLLRALRVDKMTLAALGATLQSYRGAAPEERLPLLRMLSSTLEELRARAAAYVAALPRACVVESDAYLGGGALAQERVKSIALSIRTESAESFAASLRGNQPPIVARIAAGEVILDLRTIAPHEDETVIPALASLL